MPNRIWTRIAAAGGIFYVVLTALEMTCSAAAVRGPI